MVNAHPISATPSRRFHVVKGWEINDNSKHPLSGTPNLKQYKACRPGSREIAVPARPDRSAP